MAKACWPPFRKRSEAEPGCSAKAPPPIRNDGARRVMARCPGDAAARMRSRPAVIETLHRRAVVGVAQRRTCPEQLIERESAVEDVAAGEAEDLLQVERRKRGAGDDARLESRRVTLDRVDHLLGDAVAAVVPG